MKTGNETYVHMSEEDDGWQKEFKFRSAGRVTTPSDIPRYVRKYWPISAFTERLRRPYGKVDRKKLTPRAETFFGS
jgi:hypothetical protein